MIENPTAPVLVDDSEEPASISPARAEIYAAWRRMRRSKTGEMPSKTCPGVGKGKIWSTPGERWADAYLLSGVLCQLLDSGAVSLRD